MAIQLTINEEKRFQRFIKDLEKISLKHGVAISSTGGVTIFPDDEVKMVADVEYSDDSSSGDLSWELAFQKPDVNPSGEKFGKGTVIKNKSILKTILGF